MMNCSQCQTLLSELVEASLALEVREALESHLERCAPCRKELKDLQTVLNAVKAIDKESPPSGLVESTLARLETASPPGARNRSFKWLLALAAVLLLAVNVGFLGRHFNQRTELQGQLNGLQMDLSSARNENRRLLEVVKRGREVEQRAGKLAEESLSVFEKERLAWREKLALLERLEEQGRRQGDELSQLKHQLAAAQAAELRRRDELSGLKKIQLESRAPLLAQSARPGEETAGDEPVAPHVYFSRRGDILELKLSGPKEKVFPELLAIAGDTSDPKLASLALNALENMLEPELRQAASQGPRGEDSAAGGFSFSEWWNRRTGNLPGAFGLAGEPPAEIDGGSGASHRDRLKAIETSWRQR